MFNKDACRLKALVFVKFSKERSVFKMLEEGYLELHEGMTVGGMAPFNLKNILFQNGSIKNMKLGG
jgi:hypothetical protein